MGRRKQSNENKELEQVMKIYPLYILFFLFPILLNAQTSKDSVLTGNVNFQTSENIYVNFDNTDGIHKGDTLFIKQRQNLNPAIIVNYISTKSIAGTLIRNAKLSKGDEVLAFVKVEFEKEKLLVNEVVVVNPVETEQELQVVETKEKIITTPKPEVKGRITMQSFSNFTNSVNSFDYQRWRYTFRLNANNISGSGFSYSHYLNFVYRSDQWGDINSNFGRAIRIYDLALNYDFSESTSLLFGRHINQKVSNISAVDGFQFETKVSSFSTGLILGSRPDFSNMGFNTKLFEYGIYINRFDSVGQRGMENSLGYFEQTNNSKTDRRFVYFQHINSMINNTRIFLSSEIDLYRNIPGKSKNDFSLTSLFISANVRPSSYVSLYMSYDARKSVIYYETFKSFIDSVFENETRQGFNSRITVKPVKYFYIGMNYGYRYRKGDGKPSNNYGGYLSYSKIPFIEAGISISYTNLSSTYIKGEIVGGRLYKDFDFGFGVSADYSKTIYRFNQDIEDVVQHSISFSINTLLLNPLYTSIVYEGIYQGIRTSGSIMFDLSYRF